MKSFNIQTEFPPLRRGIRALVAEIYYARGGTARSDDEIAWALIRSKTFLREMPRLKQKDRSCSGRSQVNSRMVESGVSLAPEILCGGLSVKDGQVDDNDRKQQKLIHKNLSSYR